MLFFVVASIPIVRKAYTIIDITENALQIADVAYMFFVSRPTANSICGPLLFYYELAPLMVRDIPNVICCSQHV